MDEDKTKESSTTQWNFEIFLQYVTNSKEKKLRNLFSIKSSVEDNQYDLEAWTKIP